MLRPTRTTAVAVLLLLAIVTAGLLLALDPMPSVADRGGCPHPQPSDRPGKGYEMRPDSCRGRGQRGTTTPTYSPTQPPSPAPTPTLTTSPTPTPTPSAPPSVTPAPTATSSPTSTATPTPAATASPTPSPSPSPITSLADLAVPSATLSLPHTSNVGVEFLATGIAEIHNNGPEPTANADVTFTINLPPDCTPSSPATVVVPNRVLSTSTTVSVSRSWSVTCTQTGAHQLMVEVLVAFSAGQALTDPNLLNNSNTGSASTEVN